ncbi:putative oxidative stress response protein Oxr1 [Aspergillus tubingensis]|uniref:putative oxidative stress response protein Oxr1 n=1 Tax=Aspergillus tubingensis TaxID=5068 RepID=UPI0015790C81|nr:TLD-domain-containing protein [Aspergillus tubingensis]GFN19690.1 TLD-domain-containing protein [Aspergillus tubingensis]GLB19346.1 oxidation resistance protein 1 [Aspergillus tubingensis]
MSSSSSSRSGSRPPPTTSSTSTNATTPSSLQQSAASYFSYPVTHVVSGLYRRLTDPPSTNTNNNMRRKTTTTTNDPSNPVFTPIRTASPFQPPPLTPLTLSDPSPLLTRSLAEEIRLLVPPRLQLCNTWHLAYSLDRDGASLSTLYDNCRDIASTRSPRAGYVLVIRDASPSSNAVFGAYMTDPPHPDSHYYGTGECFLWRASVLPPATAMLSNFITNGDTAGEEGGGAGAGVEAEMLEKAGLPLPPSADTTNAGRSTTLRRAEGEKWLSPTSSTSGAAGNGGASGRTSGTVTPEQIRFKAFPYSGVNDYMMFCETGFLSLGGGDGHYGLWVDSSLEKGVSASCQTFGNEPLSDEGVKFDIIDVEVWYVGS